MRWVVEVVVAGGDDGVEGGLDGERGGPAVGVDLAGGAVEGAVDRRRGLDLHRRLGGEPAVGDVDAGERAELAAAGGDRVDEGVDAASETCPNGHAGDDHRGSSGRDNVMADPRIMRRSSRRRQRG
jgi:hypothetical protein